MALKWLSETKPSMKETFNHIMDTLIEIIRHRHTRIKSASSRADIGLYNYGSKFVCYGDDADKVNTWLAGTGLCSYLEMSPEVWDWSLAELSIPLASMDRAVQTILEHASVGFVDHVTERSVPQFICYLFLKRTGTGPVPPVVKQTAVKPVAVDPLEDVF